MTYSWNASFESYPTGSMRGLTMGEGLRRIKRAFYERFIVEHQIAEGAVPTVLHPLGECQVLFLRPDAEVPVSLLHQGGMQYRKPGIFWDSGAVVEHILSNIHAHYRNLDFDDHPQYARVNGAVLIGNFSVDSVTGLDIDGANYYDVDHSERLMSHGGHHDVDADGYAYHRPEIYSRSRIDAIANKDGFVLRSGKWDYSNQIFAVAGWVDWNSEREIVSALTVTDNTIGEMMGYFCQGAHDVTQQHRIRIGFLAIPAPDGNFNYGELQEI